MQAPLTVPALQSVVDAQMVTVSHSAASVQRWSAAPLHCMVPGSQATQAFSAVLQSSALGQFWRVSHSDPSAEQSWSSVPLH
jgi:hypothetical protein